MTSLQDYVNASTSATAAADRCRMNLRSRSLSSTWEKTDGSEASDDEDQAEAKQNESACCCPSINHHTNAIRRRRRVSIGSPNNSASSGWIRGQPAEVRWQLDAAHDTSLQFVRIDVCNVAWDVPTTIAHRVAAKDGLFKWKRVYWGMPIADGYYVNIYAVPPPPPPPSDAQTDSSSRMLRGMDDEMTLLAQSEPFSVIH